MKTSNFLNSTGLFIGLLAATAFLGVSWVRAYSADNAPAIEGVDWGQHPKATLLLVPPGDCGCGMKPIEMAREAAGHHIDFIAVSAGSNEHLQEVRAASIKGSRIVVNTHVPLELIRRYCKAKSSTALQIENGRVRFQVEGNLPSDFFDRFKS
jgi:hypothetical protein